MTPQAYTRMGAAIRYLTQQFSAVDCRIKLLLTLSDGKPEDQDEYYGGIYGIEDTRQALLDAKQQGIHPFCVTIDTSAQAYLPHLYGHINYVVINKIEQLPLRLSEIYRKITT
jgi:nitric oxide reductase NorD protein